MRYLRTFAVGLLPLSGCTLISGVSGLEKVDCVDCGEGGTSVTSDPQSWPEPEGSDEELPGDVPPEPESAPLPEEMSDAGTGAGGDGGGSDAAVPDCPGTAGPRAVRVNGFCIDTTEVTNAHYARFLAAKGNDLSGQPPGCGWNSTYTPTGGWPAPPGRESYPVVYVDFCDAYAFCKWAGKRLCGRIGGDALPFGAYNQSRSSQWFNACTHAGTRAYPYGNTYSPRACNGADYSPTDNELRPVGSLPACVGGASPAVFDMSGSVWEWEDSCNGRTGSSDRCGLRGGGPESSSTNLRCNAAYTLPRSARDADIGFRCCGP